MAPWLLGFVLGVWHREQAVVVAPVGVHRVDLVLELGGDVGTEAHDAFLGGGGGEVFAGGSGMGGRPGSGGGWPMVSPTGLPPGPSGDC